MNEYSFMPAAPSAPPEAAKQSAADRKREAILDAADWIDGNETSGPQAALAKRNQQLPEFGEPAVEAGRLVLDALGRTPMFIAAALPLKIYPPYFNRYAGGETFGDHIDNAIRMRRGSDFRMRADLSATLFLADPGSYEGGGLVIEGMTAPHHC